MNKIESPIRVEFANRWWRVYWDELALIGTAKLHMSTWCKDNCSDDWHVYGSHVRFKDESDATLCYMTFK